MNWDLVGVVVFSVFAVFGLICALRAFAESFRPAEQICVAVVIRTPQDISRMDALLREARSGSLRRELAPLTVLFSRSLPGGERELPLLWQEILDRYGAEYFWIG